MAPQALPAYATHSFPAAHALQLVAVVRRWDISAEALLEGSQLTEAMLALPRARISVETMTTLSERARTLTGEPGIGFYLGLQKRASMYGFLGFAAMNAATLGQAIELAVRYTHAVTTTLSLELALQDKTASLLMHEHVGLGDAHDIAAFSLLVGLQTLASTLTGQSLPPPATDIPFVRPSYFGRFAHLIPDARFSKPCLAIHFDPSALALALGTPDPSALALARDACERELEQLDADRDLPARVRRIGASEAGIRRLDEVARSLGLSERTLKRKLALSGVSYSLLMDRERHALALRLLAGSRLTLEQIAERLGYSSLSNFARAFRRWTGETPARHRDRLR